jgi:hypothetical protein
MHKTLFAIAATASLAAALPATSLAQGRVQGLAPAPYHAVNAHQITEQLDRLGARIDRYRGRRQLSAVEAVDAQRKLAAIQDQASASRVAGGGQLSEAQRFDMQGRVDQLDREIRRERAAHGTVPAR